MTACTPKPCAKAGRLFAADALLPDGWARDVLLEWDAAGRFTTITPDVARPAGVSAAAGPVIAGMPNLHSHAFQRAFGGLTEFRGTQCDSFWSWRELMYRFALDLTPDQLEAIATWLYVEMLEAGYTSVCEFHYIHHDTDGTPYADDATLALCLIRAAERTGIGLTLLPVLYQSSNFGGVPAEASQRRFVRSTESLLALLARLKPVCDAHGARLGVAAHSLRAVTPESLHEALAGLDAIDPTAPIHIHIAEQTREVEDCLAWSGQRPVDWLLSHVNVDARWCLVHATHMTRDEAHAAARTGAVAGLCPTTEANLGDGIFDLPTWLSARAGARWGVGSDSHACVNAAQELLMLEYSQRLQLRRRSVAASVEQPQVATAMMLGGVAGGAQAAGHLTPRGTSVEDRSVRAISSAHPQMAGVRAAHAPLARKHECTPGLAIGQRADFVVLDAQHALLADLSAEQMLSAHIFASHRVSALGGVWVAGRSLVSSGHHALHDAAAAAFVAARAQLLSAVPV